MIVTDLRRSTKDARRLELFLDGEPRASLVEEFVLQAGLRVGQELTESELDQLRGRERHWAAREAALRLLSRQARTRVELSRRLTSSGHEPGVVGAVLAELAERGLVDDASVAAGFVRDRLRSRPRGRRRLIAELRGKGVSAATARAAVDTTFAEEEASELELARRAIRSRARAQAESASRAHASRPSSDTAGPTTPAAAARQAQRRRLAAFLARRGFAADIIRQVIDETLDPRARSVAEAEPDTEQP